MTGGVIGNIVVVAVLALVLFGAVFYIVREKKKGRHCIGCPYAGACGGKCGDGTAPRKK